MRHHLPTVRLTAGILLLGSLLSCGCAHKRESFYPNQRGVQVRAPFVDVHVPAGPPVSVDATGSLTRRHMREARRPSEPPLLIDEDL